MTDATPTPSEDPVAANPSAAEPSSAPPPPPPAPPSPPPAGYAAAPPPGAAPPGLFFDQGSGLNLPQGTELATHGRRIGAWFLAIPLSIVTLFIGYIIWGLIIWGRGQTPTQQVLGMRTWVPEGGQRATWGKMALREIVGVGICTSLIFITQIVSFVLFLTGRERKAIADHVASTVILRDPNNVLAEQKAAA
ncbi:MAG TPA: RDD family protein [Acidimicrobiales bacterium]|jgi:hypothetical protein|nr:RDD family protein [Acidimicrobiales bacterium]